MLENDGTIDVNAHRGFEKRLIEHLQPIRGFALATSLYHLFDLGIADAIAAEASQPISGLANRLGLDPVRLEGLLYFLQVEEFVQIRGGDVSPLRKLFDVREVWPWYEMLIGGYAQTYLDMGKGLREGSGPLARNGTRVGSGSCKISHYDAIPLTRSLLARLHKAPGKIVDLGCGNALYLKELCSLFPNLVAIGVEPDEEGHRQSTADTQFIEQSGQIRLYNLTAQEFIRNTQETHVDAVIIAFVLQEILGQDGRLGAIEFLKQVASKFPDAHVVVIEVDNKAHDIKAMSHPLAQSYYNPYYLVHYFTDQVLEGPDFWLKLFNEAGLQLVAQSTTNPNVDSTSLELGFLLKCSGA
jgi:2-ketoarginine methyltransferase